jgi:hypothetical protein
MRKFRAISTRNGRIYTFYDKKSRDEWVNKDDCNRRILNVNEISALWRTNNNANKKYIS